MKIRINRGLFKTFENLSGLDKGNVLIGFDEIHKDKVLKLNVGDYMGAVGYIQNSVIDDFSVSYSLSIHGEKISAQG